MKTVHDLYIKFTTHYIWQDPVPGHVLSAKGKTIFPLSMVLQPRWRDALWMNENITTIKAVYKKKQIRDAENKQ